jgi:hypothetical protein
MGSAAYRAALWGGLLSVACDRDWRLAIERPWDATSIGVVVVQGANGELLSEPQLVGSGERLELQVRWAPPLRLWGLAFSPELELLSRGVRLGGAEDHLPDGEPWLLELEALGDESAPQFQRAEAPGFDLRYNSPSPPTATCLQAEARQSAWPERLTRVEVTGAGRLYVGMGSGPAAVARVEAGMFTEIFRFPPNTSGPIRGLVHDGQRLWVVAREGAMVALDDQHQVLMRGQLPFDEVVEVYANHQGEVYAMGLPHELPRQLSLSATVGQARTNFPTNLRGMAVLESGKAFVLDQRGILARTDDGWLREVELQEAEMTAIAGDHRGAYAIARYRGFFSRDQRTGVWSETPRPFAGFPRALALLPGGGLVVVGSGDSSAYFDGRHFCLIRPPIVEELVDVAVSADGRTAWAVGNIDGEPPGRWVEMSLPPPN